MKARDYAIKKILIFITNNNMFRWFILKAICACMYINRFVIVNYRIDKHVKGCKKIFIFLTDLY